MARIANASQAGNPCSTPAPPNGNGRHLDFKHRRDWLETELKSSGAIILGDSVKCPFHDDKNNSGSIYENDKGQPRYHCHGCGKDGDYADVRGWRTGKSPTEVMSQLRQGAPRGRIVATYDYVDLDGTLLYQKVRFDPKDFRQRRPDGTGGFEWGINGTKRVLYRLPELLASTGMVFVVEGEKDVDRLRAAGLAATCNVEGASKSTDRPKWRDEYSSHLRGRHVVIIADRDAAGRSHAQAVARSVAPHAAAVKVIEVVAGKDASDFLDAGGTAAELVAVAEAAPAWAPAAPCNTPPPTNSARPRIIIDTEEHRVIAETVAALAADPIIFQRGGILARVQTEEQPNDGIMRVPGSPTIQRLPMATLRERMTRHASFVKFNREGEELAAHPPAWAVSAIDVRGEWSGIRPLLGVSDAPILRADGSVHQDAGYDARTGVLFVPAPGVTFPTIQSSAGRDDAHDAASRLLDVMSDFPFEEPMHRAAALAALLTPLGRFAFTGPAPLFLGDANVRGAGKGMMFQVMGRIALGREMPVSSYSHDPAEMRKRITACAIAGDRVILLDNLDGVFGNDALDRALTSTRWKDRILGKSEEIELPLLATWYATGNNVSVAADTARRIIHIRLDAMTERPEERTGFKHSNLLAWVTGNRGSLLADALTILAAYCRAGRPSHRLTPYGSFEGWSGLIREAIVWVGLHDPCATRIKLAESSDTTADALAQLIAAWKAYHVLGGGVLVSEMLGKLYPADRQYTPNAASDVVMRAALENLVGCPPGRVPSTRQVGTKLRSFRRRVAGGCFFDIDRVSHSAAVWKLHESG